MSVTCSVNINLDHIHCRAICDEIGERLVFVLRKDTSELPPYLEYLMARLAAADCELAPSIVPSISDMTDRQKPLTDRPGQLHAYTELAAV
jgi:hypothetical protein